SYVASPYTKSPKPPAIDDQPVPSQWAMLLTLEPPIEGTKPPAKTEVPSSSISEDIANTIPNGAVPGCPADGSQCGSQSAAATVSIAPGATTRAAAITESRRLRTRAIGLDVSILLTSLPVSLNVNLPRATRRAPRH